MAKGCPYRYLFSTNDTVHMGCWRSFKAEMVSYSRPGIMPDRTTNIHPSALNFCRNFTISWQKESTEGCVQNSRNSPWSNASLSYQS